MTAPNQHLLNSAVTARAALHALAELLHDTHAGDPLLGRVDGTGDAIQRWLERHMPLGDVAPVAPGVAPHQSDEKGSATTFVAPAVTPVAPERPATMTAAVQLASGQLPEGATSTEIARYVLTEYGIEVEPGAVRTVLNRQKKKRQAQQGATPVAPQPQPLQPDTSKVLRGTGGYL